MLKNAAKALACAQILGTRYTPQSGARMAAFDSTLQVLTAVLLLATAMLLAVLVFNSGKESAPQSPQSPQGLAALPVLPVETYKGDRRVRWVPYDPNGGHREALREHSGPVLFASNKCPWARRQLHVLFKMTPDLEAMDIAIVVVPLEHSSFSAEVNAKVFEGFFPEGEQRLGYPFWSRRRGSHIVARAGLMLAPVLAKWLQE